ncbi:MAG TPA: DUF4920 domain-containing protein [Crocinitomicaceae bacterium]|nr:DUF4920 domain-containing protein [Crocinitomicaceae bacterium]
MKGFGIIVGVALLATSCSSENTEVVVDEVVEVAELGESYGEVKVNIEDAISVEEMLNEMDKGQESKEFTIEADIEEVCSKAGCWVNIDKGNGETFMVRFKDHFTIPPATEIGTGAYLHGSARWDTIPVDLLQHFAEDAGKSEEEIAAITEPKFEIGFEADGITLKK